MRVRGGGNLGRAYYHYLDTLTRARGGPYPSPSGYRTPHAGVGKLARTLGTSARQARRIIRAARRAQREAANATQR